MPSVFSFTHSLFGLFHPTNLTTFLLASAPRVAAAYDAMPNSSRMLNTRPNMFSPNDQSPDQATGCGVPHEQLLVCLTHSATKPIRWQASVAWPSAMSFTLPSQSTADRYPVRANRVHPKRAPTDFSNSPIRFSRIPNLRKPLCLSNGDVRGVGEKDGVIIVDHGSRRRESNLMLDEFVAMFRDKTGYQIVEPAHMELASPSIQDAFGLCVEQGAERVIVSPFFLFPGRHWHQDIPLLTAQAATEHPRVPYIITAPLGLHTLLVDVVNDRIKHCLSHVAGDADECAVCVGTSKCNLYESVDLSR